MSRQSHDPGTSSGFGRDTAEDPARAGHTVYASMAVLKGHERTTSSPEGPAQAHGIKTGGCDVQRRWYVEGGVKTVLAEDGKSMCRSQQRRYRLGRP